MPPVRPGRASKACASCRRQKTRCYDAENSRGACLRCETLKQPCSLEQYMTRRIGISSAVSDPPHQTGTHIISADERIARLEDTVSRLVERLETGSTALAAGHVVEERDVQPLPTTSDESSSAAAPPVLLIRDVATEVGVQPGYNASEQLQQAPDVIASGLITAEHAINLLSIFQEHYGRWVAFDESVSVEMLMRQVRKSPLLLCSVCLIAVRHTTQELALLLAPTLFNKAKSLVSASLLATSQSIETFQAAVILSMWSTTIGQVPLGVDSWLLSGFTLQHCLANPLFEHVQNGKAQSSFSKLEMERWRIWNHLCLVHLHYCVGTRRVSMLNRMQIGRCRQILDSDRATNFEARMVAEVELYWVIYGKCTNSPVDLPEAQTSLHSWKQEWNTLFDQPRSQFLQMGYHFAQLLAFGQSLKSGTAAMRESLLSEMVRLCSTILNLAIETTDDRTRHLTDHIYHIITYAAVTLCRLLNSYEIQLRTLYDVVELDSLVLQLVGWLRLIGLPCHVAHTLGDIVSAFHKKLRPQAHLLTYANSESGQSVDPEIAFMFPELLASELYGVDNGEMWPDYESYEQERTV